MILDERIERNIYMNQNNFLQNLQLVIKHSYLLAFSSSEMSSITVQGLLQGNLQPVLKSLSEIS